MKRRRVMTDDRLDQMASVAHSLVQEHMAHNVADGGDAERPGGSDGASPDDLRWSKQRFRDVVVYTDCDDQELPDSDASDGEQSDKDYEKEIHGDDEDARWLKQRFRDVTAYMAHDEIEPEQNMSDEEGEENDEEDGEDEQEATGQRTAMLGLRQGTHAAWEIKQGFAFFCTLLKQELEKKNQVCDDKKFREIAQLIWVGLTDRERQIFIDAGAREYGQKSNQVEPRKTKSRCLAKAKPRCLPRAKSKCLPRAKSKCLHKVKSKATPTVKPVRAKDKCNDPSTTPKVTSPAPKTKHEAVKKPVVEVDDAMDDDNDDDNEDKKTDDMSMDEEDVDEEEEEEDNGSSSEEDDEATTEEEDEDDDDGED